MWLLGAGASAAAGIPTAGDLIWEFKQLLYTSQKKVSRNAVSDLSSPSNRKRLQEHIDAAGSFPTAGDPEEYAALFEEVFPAEVDRQTFINSKTSGAKPSYGHMALAALMRAGHVRLLWTTNFDTLIADACAKVYDGTGHLTTANLDAPNVGAEAVQNEKWPIEIKLHGDFRSRRLKNTIDELRHQDAKLRQLLLECCGRFGLVIVGYSGRDESIMEVLDAALTREVPFPRGLFWLNKRGGILLPRVARFINQAQTKNVETATVGIENFDETLRDLTRLTPDVDAAPLTAFASERKKWSPAPSPAGKRSWPVLRLNAIEITECPPVARRISCSAGGYAELREIFADISDRVIFARNRSGVLAFGPDEEVRRKLETYKIENFDLFTIEMHRMRHETHERGLVKSGLTRALARTRNLNAQHRRSFDYLYPKDVNSSALSSLREIVGSLSGKITGHPELNWFEGVELKLDWADERLWLLLEPRIIFQGLDAGNKSYAADFARERSVKRYNATLNKLIDFWGRYLAGSGEEIAAFETVAGVNAKYRLSKDSAFSWRVTA